MTASEKRSEDELPAVADLQKVLAVIGDACTAAAASLTARRDELDTLRCALQQLDALETTRQALLRSSLQTATRIDEALDDDQLTVAALASDLHGIGAQMGIELPEPRGCATDRQVELARAAVEAASQSVAICISGLTRTRAALRPLLDDLQRHTNAGTPSRPDSAADVGTHLAVTHARMLTATLQTQHARQAALALDSDGRRRLNDTNREAQAPGPKTTAIPSR